MKHLLAAFAAICLCVSSAAWGQTKTVDDLPWELGPTKAQLGTNASIDVPEGYAFLGPTGVREFNVLSENPDPGGEQFLLAKRDLSWVAFFAFNLVGYVKDDETLDADALLKSISEGTEAANEEREQRGWGKMHVLGWSFPPQYDGQSKALEWAIRGKSEDSASEIINYNTRLLGRRGVMEVTLVTAPEGLKASVADFKQKLPGFKFVGGEGYADFRPGDHVAEYGLAALVTGGAAAVAAKKGMFAVIGVFLLKMWKLALVAALGGFAMIRKLFARKDKDPSS